jgi:predicted membrane protein
MNQSDTLPDAHATPWHPLSLGIALVIILGGSFYPFMFASSNGKADHGLASVIFWAMSAGLVHGVGFVPRFALWRWLFSGWACCLALSLAAWVRFCQG